MSICKVSETGDPPVGWGVQAKRGQIPRNEAYREGRRSASGPEGLRPGGMRVTQPFDSAQGHELVEWQMGVFRQPQGPSLAHAGMLPDPLGEIAQMVIVSHGVEAGGRAMG